MTEIDRYAKVLHTLIKEEFDLVPIPAHFIMGNVLTSLIATIVDYRILPSKCWEINQIQKFYEKEKINCNEISHTDVGFVL